VSPDRAHRVPAVLTPVAQVLISGILRGVTWRSSVSRGVGSRPNQWVGMALNGGQVDWLPRGPPTEPSVVSR
jgi:hypothetical protein